MAKNKQYNPTQIRTVKPISEFDGKFGEFMGKVAISCLAFLLALVIGAGIAAALYLVVYPMFEGSPIAYVVLGVAGLFVLFFLFFAFAWAKTIRLRWSISHTRIMGHRLQYVGGTWALAFMNIKWFFCSVFTLFVYALWLPIKRREWFVENIKVDHTAPMMEMQAYYQQPEIPEYFYDFDRKGTGFNW